MRFACSPRRSGRSGPRGPRREGEDAALAAAAVWTRSLAPAQPRDCIFNPCFGCCIFNPWSAVWGSSVVSPAGARRGERRWQALALGIGGGGGLAALRRPAEVEAHSTCQPLPPVPRILIPLQMQSGCPGSCYQELERFCGDGPEDTGRDCGREGRVAHSGSPHVGGECLDLVVGPRFTGETLGASLLWGRRS